MNLESRHLNYDKPDTKVSVRVCLILVSDAEEECEVAPEYINEKTEVGKFFREERLDLSYFQKIFLLLYFIDV